jgi:hypothetical protein
VLSDEIVDSRSPEGFLGGLGWVCLRRVGSWQLAEGGDKKMGEDGGRHVVPLSIRGVLRVWSRKRAAHFSKTAFLSEYRGIFFHFGNFIVFWRCAFGRAVGV